MCYCMHPCDHDSNNIIRFLDSDNSPNFFQQIKLASSGNCPRDHTKNDENVFIGIQISWIAVCKQL